MMNVQTQTFARTAIPRNLGVLFFVGGLGLLIGLGGLFPLFLEGHRMFNTGSMDKMVWGIAVVTYAYLALASFGVTLVTMLGSLFRLRGCEPLLMPNLLLALALAIGAVAALALELGHPVRAIWAMPFNLQFRSPFYWMGIAWTAYLALLLIALGLSFRSSPGKPFNRKLGVLLVLAALGALTVQALVYGLMAMRPVWFSSTLPLYFLIGAVLVGLSLIVLFTHIAHGFDAGSMPEDTRRLMADGVPTALLTILVVYLLATASRVVTGLWSNLDGHRIVYEHLIRSGWFHLEVWVGLLLPVVLLSLRKLSARPAVQSCAAVLLLTAAFIGRYEFIIGGQRVPLFKGTWVPGLIDYTPSVTEWMVSVFAFSLVLALYAMGSRMIGFIQARG